jgi:hypothetical protein
VFKFLVPTTKEYQSKDVLPIRVRWLFQDYKKEFKTDLFIKRKDWDFKREVPKASCDPVIRKQFFDYEEKANDIWYELKKGSIPFHQILEVWNSGSLKVRSVDAFIETHLKRLKTSTLTSRKNSLRSFKKHLFGNTDQPLMVADITNRNCRIVYDNMRSSSLAQATINTCLKGIRATYNDMYKYGVDGVKNELKIERGLIKKSRPNIPTILRTEDYLKGIDNIKSQLDWEAMAIGVLSFALRGLDLVDLFKISSSNIESVKKYEDYFDIYITTESENEHPAWLTLTRSKVPDGSPMAINLSLGGEYTALLHLLKKSLESTRPHLKTTDSFALTSLHNDFEFGKYRALTQAQSKAFKKLTGSPYKVIRKSFRTLASVYCNVSTEIGNALLGQENQNISVNYLDMGQLKDHIDSVHQQVLREYKMNDIAIGLINKGRELWVREDGSLTPLTNLDLTFFEWFYDLDR